MNLQDRFNMNPTEATIKEFPKGSGIKYIGIKDIKFQLHSYFDKWGTSNLKVQYIQLGRDLMISGSVELHLELDSEKFTFIGANSFKTGIEQPEGNNDNYEAILLANCIKNASKNIGNFFGQNLNTIDEYLPTIQVAPTKKKKDPMKQAIDKLVK